MKKVLSVIMAAAMFISCFAMSASVMAKDLPELTLKDSVSITASKNGSDSIPEGCTPLHFFTYAYAANIADKAFSDNDEKGGIYLYWKVDEAAALTASAFNNGYIAISAAAGLILGIIGTAGFMSFKRKKEENPA